MSRYDYVIFASYGNDSIALIQFAKNEGLKNVCVLYSDTGWSADWWIDRVEKGESLAKSYGFDVARTKSEGMEALVKRKKGWPMGGGAAFCTAELKVKPALAWLDENDPEKESICMVGVRREESANRRTFPKWTDSSEKHGGRELYAPLVNFNEYSRNDLLSQAGFTPLEHRSKECFPCVHANINDLRMLDEERIIHIERIEGELGVNSKGNPRVMFRPKRHKGAVGIRAVVDWAITPRKRDQLDLFGCDSGYCGS
ncbi:phosphoadenosine phosphosulfate reductase family protein [Pseudoalteromonas sp.]|uniref:phosphoadenosine phosphosulfate reductase domain-containing protein n=1 Tax=Pseudoalteromonas sp. TaxID=53249 RepID=UPI00356A33C2